MNNIGNYNEVLRDGFTSMPSMEHVVKSGPNYCLGA